MDYENLSAEDLSNTLCGLRIATLKAGAYLSLLCGDADEARRHIRLALDLPPPVLRRRYDDAQAVIQANGDLSIDQAAAWIACGHFTVQQVEAMLARKQANAPIQ